jgi:hypothetical protein
VIKVARYFVFPLCVDARLIKHSKNKRSAYDFAVSWIKSLSRQDMSDID